MTSFVRPGGMLAIGVLSDLPKRDYVVATSAPAPTATVQGCLAALERLATGRMSTAPRWAVAAWLVDLVGEQRSMPRPGPENTADVRELGTVEIAAKLDRWGVEPAETVWPAWIGDRRDDLLLDVGVSAGRPGKKVRCRVPVSAADHVVAVPGDVGLVRFRHPLWTGEPMTTDPRLAAVAELARSGGDMVRADVAALVCWCVGRGRAWTGSWAERRSLPETKPWAARKAFARMTQADPDVVLREVLTAASEVAA